MNRPFGRLHFWTTSPVSNCCDGFTALRLHRDLDGTTALVAEVVFWDAVGQYFLQTFQTDVPVEIVEALIAEANDLIPYK
jgi:hypothetical protein